MTIMIISVLSIDFHVNNFFVQDKKFILLAGMPVILLLFCWPPFLCIFFVLYIESSIYKIHISSKKYPEEWLAVQRIDGINRLINPKKKIR